MSHPTTGRRRLLLGTGTLGFGLGAVLDVVVFHMILQWHHLLSDRIPTTTLRGLRANVYFDGVFSFAMLGVALVGSLVVWNALNQASESLSPIRALGGVLVGIGLFNVFDGVVDHYILNIHDVVHGMRAFNSHWVGASLLLLGAGILVLERSR